MSNQTNGQTNNHYNEDISPLVRRNAGLQGGKASQGDGGAPWHRREDETEKAYEAFLVYLDMGKDRSKEGVAEILYGIKGPSTNINKWSRSYKWTDRAKAWDTYVSETRMTQMEEAVQEAEQIGLRYLPVVTQELSQAAAGQKNISREQISAIKDYMDRFGPAKQRSQQAVNVTNFDVKFPSLPDGVTKTIEDVEEAEFEEITDHADDLIPQELQEKRRGNR